MGGSVRAKPRPNLHPYRSRTDCCAVNSTLWPTLVAACTGRDEVARVIHLQRACGHQRASSGRNTSSRACYADLVVRSRCTPPQRPRRKSSRLGLWRERWAGIECKLGAWCRWSGCRKHLRPYDRSGRPTRGRTIHGRGRIRLCADAARDVRVSDRP